MTNEVKEDPCKITDAVKNDTKESKLESERSKDTPEPSKVSPEKSKLSPKSGDTMSTTDHFGEANQSIDEKIDFESQKLDGVYNQVKNLMTQNGIKLWLEPYYDTKTSSPSEESIFELACNLSSTLELEETVVYNGLIHWQENALEKLQARETFKEKKLIMLRLKWTKNFGLKKPPTTIEVPADFMGKNLCAKLAKMTDQDPSGIKMISNGRVLTNDDLLSSQNIKPGSVIMVAKINKDDGALQVLAEQKNILQKTKDDVKLLGETDEGGLEILNQNGEKIALPKDEQKALIMAMSLDEKGRACMKRKEYDLALVLLLEACHEYQQCRSELLERSDNYGLINLEIAWCYLQLGNVSQLPDAEIRLQECQRNFERIHGKNMERVLAVKGSNANEKTLYTRLNLMQGICAYHQGNKSKAELLLKHVQKEIKALEIPEDALEEVIALGYSDKEARIALRAMNNQVSDAVRFANKLREDRARVEEANRKRAKYGKVANGSWVNVGYVKTLVAMGYLEDHAVTALKQTNNEMSQSIDLITNSPDVVDAALQSSLMDESAADAATADLKNIASTSKDALRRSEKLQEAAKVVQANKRARKEATERFREELGDSLGSTDGYMALPLEEEARFLEKYLKFLEYNGTSSEQD